MEKLPLANYTEEQAHFQELLDRNSRQRILMFQGESGAGKTRLLEYCVDSIPSHIAYLSIQLRGQDTTAMNVFYRLGRRVGWERLQNFTQQVAVLMNSPHAHTDLIWRHGLRQHLQSIMQIESVTDQKDRRAVLTDALFADLQAFQTPRLLIFDTYEQATTELDEWFSSHFLPWVSDTDSLRVLVAGQKLPEESADWRHCCNIHKLDGIRDAQAWLPVAHAMGRTVPSLDYLAGACAMADGNPSKILDFVRLLPVTGEMRQPQQTIAETRTQLRRSMVDRFEDQDLRDLCFDFNIDYENLGHSDNKRAKVIAIIEYMDHRARLPELVIQCKELRPGMEW